MDIADFSETMTNLLGVEAASDILLNFTSSLLTLKAMTGLTDFAVVSEVSLDEFMFSFS